MEKHYVDISTMFQEADDALFRTILSNRSHVLCTYLSERPEIAYSLELETTIKFLSPKLAISGIDTLSLYSSIKTYTDAILQINLIRRYICHHGIFCMYMCMNFVHTVAFYNCRYHYCYSQFVTIALYCMYTCMNFVHTVVFDNCL